ncbi:SusC/RagA family TonB-linked outer membrane protein [Pedobacter nanyangensis]|uniref:SusC/RagA family TonB-linked outer membrane protein n=1 Tax=Pedobacter nanyangensis TaxID=1562389 RepID=UPI000DE31AA2|nr:TonB-dependent receptor [Pedobacter nanyangensis]
MKKLLQSLFILLFVASTAMAQNRTITGTVTSKEDGLPLPGVSVKVKGSSTGVSTGANGRFSIVVGANVSALEITSIGYVTQTVNLGSSNTVNVSLETDSKGLSEVVVTGYGTQKKTQLTGSVSIVSGKDIENLPVQTFDKALQGRAAGVQVTTNSGQPGSGITVNIRGLSTINGATQPLYIVDGVQVSAGGVSTQTTQNVLGAINPADIESIQILKDAATASIYGSQAANGVVIVTTKRGRAGKTQITAAVQQGVNEQLRPYDMLTGPEWYNLRLDAIKNWAARTGYPYADALEEWNETIFGAGVTTAPAVIPSYDWYNEIFRVGRTGQYDLSARGGNEKTKFFISAGYNDIKGAVMASSYNRGNLRANLDHQISDKVSFETSITLAATQSVGHGTNRGFYTNTPFTGALFTPPTNAIYNPDGTYNNNLYGAYGYNVVQGINEEQRKTTSVQTISNVALNYQVLPELKLRAYAGVDFADAKNYNYRPSTLPAYAPTGGTGNENFIRNVNYNTSVTANYNKTFNNDHNFSALAGFEYRSASQTQLSVGVQGFPSPLLTLLGSASTNTSYGSTFTGYKIASLIGNINYDYKGKYLLTGNLRYDGSSRFGADQKFGLFGGVSAGWRISGEDFMKSVSFVNDLKLRASYGVTGVQPTADFGALTLFTSGGAAGAYNGGGSLRPSQLGNAALSWEASKQLGAGLDFSLFGGRLSGAFDVFKKNNTKLLLSRTLPANSGFTGITENAGEVESKGIETELTSVNINTKSGFKWSTSFNIAFVKNKLLSLNAGATRIGNSYIVGEPLNVLWTYRYAGVNPADGRAMYYDKNNNITYQPVTADQTKIGDSNPNFYGGFINTFSYKGLTLDVMFQYQYGNHAYIQTQQVVEAAGSGYDNQVRRSLTDRWTTPGQITDIPRSYDTYIEPGSSSSDIMSSRFIQKASYIRLKQVTLNYKLPTKFTSKIGIPSISVFAQGVNLLTFTNYRGEDPENVGANNLNGYPNSRTITGGLTVQF